uniref:Peroxisomal membrane protein PEX14 n=1 Tax=Kalanchoe fedtschenkoi TaxID=63787 RepID=A0A7N0TZS2_KALFE
MATQSTPPAPNPLPEEPANSGSPPGQPTFDSRQETGTTATVERSAPSVFVNSEPIREDQVQNAVKFLSHPKVRGSPVMYRRSFLEKKGLSREEIDEAFRRVPDTSPPTTSVPATVTTQDGQLKTSTAVQAVAPAQNLQLAAPATVSKTGFLTQFGWSHAFLAIGLLAASGAGTALLVKKSIIPRLKSWIRKVVSEDDEEKTPNSKPNLAEEATAAAKAAAAAASDVAKVSQELLSSKHAERIYFEEFKRALDLQVQEMVSMSKSMRNLEGKTFSYSGEEDPRAKLKKPYANGKVDVDVRSVRSSTPSVDNSAPPHPKSYMEIMSMIQRGEKPDNIREINDLPPNPNQQLSNPRLAPITKPWETAQSQPNSTQVFSGDEGYNLQDRFYSQINGNGSVIGRQQRNSGVTEIETENESRVPAVAKDSPVVRRWVPPQPPPVVMPEAAEAIRRPKSIPKEPQPTYDDRASVQSSDGADELQRITKISELGGSSENSRIDTEIQEEHDYTGEEN